MANGCISPQEFTSFLVTQLPVYDREIIRDIRPEDGWIGHVETGSWEPFSSNEHTFDRFKQVMPNVTKQWQAVPSHEGRHRRFDRQQPVKLGGVGATPA